MATRSDNFDRANSTSLGANWTEDSGDWAITGNTVYNSSSGGQYRKLRWAGASMDSNDYSVEGIFRADDGSLGIGPAARCAASSAVTYYAFIMFGGDNAYLVYINAGGETVLQAASGVSFSTATAYTLRIEVEGTAIRGYVNGTLRASTTHSALTSGAPGIAGYGGNRTLTYGDDWTASDLAAVSDPQVSVSDAVTVAEAITAAVSDPQVSVSDAVTVAEAITAVVSDPQVSVSDAVTVAEAITTVVSDPQVSVSDAVTVAEAITAVVSDPQVSVSDAVVVAEAVAVEIIDDSSILSISVVESVSVAEAVTVALPDALAFSVVESVSVAEVFAIMLTRIAGGDWSLTDAAVNRLALTDAAVNRLALTDAAVYVFSLEDTSRI